MAISLQSLASGDTNYITKHNTNYGAISSAINGLLNDVDAIKNNASPGSDNDYRLLAWNILLNHSFQYFQRGAGLKPDGWNFENTLSGFSAVQSTVNVQLGDYSLKVVGGGQITQSLPDEVIAGLPNGASLSLFCYVTSDQANSARVGIYNGVTTTYTDYHAGDGNTEIHKLSYVNGETTVPTAIKIVIDNADGATSYFNIPTLIKGNPRSGPVPIFNDPKLEKIRILSLYEKGTIDFQGIGVKINSDRVIRKTIYFCAPKKNAPTIVLPGIDQLLITPWDMAIENVTECSFDLVLTDLGGASAIDGIDLGNVSWTAES